MTSEGAPDGKGVRWTPLLPDAAIGADPVV